MNSNLSAGIEKAIGKGGKPLAGAAKASFMKKCEAAPAPTASDLAVTLDVEPRKPRLAWQGMERKEMAGAVPTQVLSSRRGYQE